MAEATQQSNSKKVKRPKSRREVVDWPRERVEILVGLYRKDEVVSNEAHPHYKAERKPGLAWERVGHKMGLAEVVQSKFFHLRSVHLRRKAKAVDNAKRKNPWLDDLFSFLDDPATEDVDEQVADDVRPGENEAEAGPMNKERELPQAEPQKTKPRPRPVEEEEAAAMGPPLGDLARDLGKLREAWEGERGRARAGLRHADRRPPINI